MRNHTFGNEFFGIDVSRVFVISDGLVEFRLGESRFVPLIVSVFSITEQIDKDISFKTISVGYRKVHGVNHRLHIIRIDMQDW